MNPKLETTKPSDCIAKGHEITRIFGEAKDGRVEADCICWTCPEINSWVEAWVVEKMISQ